MLGTALRLICVTPIVVAGSAFAEDTYPDGAFRAFGNWGVTCDNAHTCWLQSAGGSDAVITLRRDAGPEARPIIVLSRYEGSFERATFDAKGFEAAFVGAIASMYGEDYGPRLTIADGEVDLFVAALTKAASLTDPADEGFEIALAGASDGLGFVDEVQGRNGTVTALVAKGDKSANGPAIAPVFPTIAAPVTSVTTITTPPDSALIAAREAACTEDAESRNPDVLPEGYRLADGREIWFMPCFDGPYNYVSTPFLKTGAIIAPLPFTGPDADFPKPEDLALLWNPSLNVEDKNAPLTLATFGKNRGMGDCGAISEHVWTGEAFALTGYRVMEGCSGLWDDEWPVRWQAKVAIH
jgi:hypothetical protein